ncbi:MAG: tyrosine recombinase [Candidatus Mycalebacterium zealandia]|nr:MAG: tyrosine recombinase [Candidatus Mycalebacterium zealandia]
MKKKDVRGFLEGFRSYLEYERNLSPNTVRAYMSDVRQFADFIIKSGLKLSAIEVRDINRYIAERFDKRNSKTSTVRKLAAVRTFFRFLNIEGVTSGNPAKSAVSPKRARSLPSFLSVDEIDALLRAMKPQDGRLALRDRAMFELAYSSGLRVSELVSLKVEDIDFEQSLVRVFGKGGKERMVPFGSKAAEALKRYLEIRDTFKPGTARIFVGSKKTGITSRSVSRILKSYALAAGVNKNISPHTLRHSCATHLLAADDKNDKGANKDKLRAIQLILGHSSLSSTQKYTHISVEQLMSIYDNTHPRA